MKRRKGRVMCHWSLSGRRRPITRVPKSKCNSLPSGLLGKKGKNGRVYGAEFNYGNEKLNSYLSTYAITRRRSRQIDSFLGV